MSSRRESPLDFALHLFFIILGIALGSLLVQYAPWYIALPVILGALVVAWKCRP